MKKILDLEIFAKRSPNEPKIRHFDIFLKNGPKMFLVFGLKLVLNMTFGLNETYFSEKFAIWGYLISKLSKNCTNWGFWPFSRLCIISFLWFSTLWLVGMMSSCFLQFAGPVYVYSCSAWNIVKRFFVTKQYVNKNVNILAWPKAKKKVILCTKYYCIRVFVLVIVIAKLFLSSWTMKYFFCLRDITGRLQWNRIKHCKL